MSMLVDAKIAQSVIEEDLFKIAASACNHLCALKRRLDSREAIKAELWCPPAIDPIFPQSQNMSTQARPGAHLKPGVSALMDRLLHRVHQNPVHW
jgi:hypothetical protein